MPRKGGDKRPSSYKRRALRHQIHTEQLGCCYWCGERVEKADMQLDRVKSGKFGGTYHYENLVGACAGCNLRRGRNEAQDLTKREAKRLYTPMLRELAAKRSLIHA